MEKKGGISALIASCAVMFWIGTFIFGLPGVMAGYWQETLEVGRSSVAQVQFWILFALGVCMFAVGKLQERLGPGIMGVIGALLMGVGTVSLGFGKSLWALYAWGFAMGMASSFLYIPALTVVQLWYPLRKGLVVGLVNLSFGLSASIMAPVYSRVLHQSGAHVLGVTFGTLALITGFVLAPFMKFPAPTAVESGTGQVQSTLSRGARGSLRSRNFWLIWGTWALAGGAGFSMVTMSTMFGTAKGLTPDQAVIILLAFGLTNGLSRFFSGYFSDSLGRVPTLTGSFLAAGLAYALLPHVQGLILWAVLAGVVGCGFGTLFAVSAPLVAECFGLLYFGTIFGMVFTAYGFLAGLLGPWLGGYMLDATGDAFEIVFTYMGLCLFLAAFLISRVRIPDTEKI
ncbi:MAG: MFS transporter [Desulfovermiculus sp.]|nr:MFS transporter [Desulfovermiculus sp.]